MTDAARFDDGKAPIHFIPPELILALAEHYRNGAAKYGDHNWLKGMDHTRVYNSLMRHALAWMAGEDIDPETGSHHMIAAMWNAGALYYYTLKGLGKDDRPFGRRKTQKDAPAEDKSRTKVPLSHNSFPPSYWRG